MDPEYWLRRWREGRTGWHHVAVMPLLEEHWPALDLPRGTRVLVPLAGKSLDMLWLARQGLGVLGVELSPIAVESFLAENRLGARTVTGPQGTRYRVTSAAGVALEILNGDLFAADSAEFAQCGAFYDRAALIALPPDLRDRLVREVYARLPAGSRGLLITLDYPQQQMDGPPFSVDPAEVQRLFAANWEIERFERRDILHSEPRFSEQGVTALHTTVYGLTRRST